VFKSEERSDRWAGVKSQKASFCELRSTPKGKGKIDEYQAGSTMVQGPWYKYCPGSNRDNRWEEDKLRGRGATTCSRPESCGRQLRQSHAVWIQETFRRRSHLLRVIMYRVVVRERLWAFSYVY